MKVPCLFALPVSLATLLVAGCSESEPPQVARVASPTVTSVAVEQVRPDEAVRLDAARALREAMANYVAPFPERTELFVPPKDIPTASSGPLAESDVQLRGVVTLGEPRAILDIEGATAVVAVGGEKYGVKVIAIDDRKVQLERGPTRWTASLE